MEEFEELIKDKEIYILGKTSKDFRIGFDEDILILKPDGTYEYIEKYWRKYLKIIYYDIRKRI